MKNALFILILFVDTITQHNRIDFRQLQNSGLLKTILRIHKSQKTGNTVSDARVVAASQVYALPAFIGETTPDVSGNGPFSVSFNFDLTADGSLLIRAFPDTSVARESFTVSSATLSTVPEPDTLLLVGLGLLGLAGIRHRKLKNNC